MDTTEQLDGVGPTQAPPAVAIVHADSTFAKIVAAQASALGCVAVTSSARMATRDLVTQRASALVLDWDAPDSDGRELLQSLSEEETKRVLVCSRFGEQARAEYVRTGGKDQLQWLQTPCAPGVLVEALHRLIAD